MLVELYGDKYYIFPQINYSHLIQPKKSSFEEERKYRSKIDRKSADFVFCDKEKIIPQLIIELDGYVHNFKSKQARDQFIDEITGIVDLPILHLKTNNLDKEFVKNKIDEKLKNES
jgi:very-short-patch-repair endonuclease